MKIQFFNMSYLCLILVNVMGILLFCFEHSVLFYSSTLFFLFIINILLINIIKRDVTAARERGFYQSILKDAQDINIYVIDKNLNYLLLSKSDIIFMEKYFNVTPKVGENLSLYLSQEHYLITKKNLEEAFKGNLTNVLDHFNFNGEELFLNNYYSPLYDRNNNIYAILCFTVNLTADVKSQQENFKMIYQDPLTGVYNRRKLREYFETIRYEKQKDYWMLLLDIDKFKEVNDTHGHLYGDSVLVELAACLRYYFPNPASIFRIGGDEFCIIMEENSKVDTQELIKNATFSINNDLSPNSISLGYTRINGDDSYPLDDYYEIADKNMYNNKNEK